MANTTDIIIGWSKVDAVSVERYLRRSLTADEKDLVKELISKIEAEIVSRTGRNFDVDTIYEESFGSGISKFILHNIPPQSLEGVKIDGVDKTSNYIENEDYWVQDYYIEFASPLVSSTGYPKSIKLSYKIKKFWSDDVVDLVRRWAARSFLTSADGGVDVSNMSFSETSQTLDLVGFKSEIDNIIKRYTDFQV